MFGFERSGTTLLSMMMGAHPELAVPLSVTGLWYIYAEELHRYNDLESSDDLRTLVSDLLKEERIGLWDVEISEDEILQELQPASFSAVVRRFHEIYAAKKGKPNWGNLDIATLDEMDCANSWFPEARFLHIVRDGRDVALSHETMPYGAGNTLECAEHWTQRIHANLKMGSMLHADRYHVIRYEDLVTKTEETLREICRFAGLSYSESMLSYMTMVEDKIPSDKRWLWPALAKRPDPAKAFRWKNNMSRPKRLVFESVAAPMLRRLGYEVASSVPKSFSRFAFEFLCLLDRGGRFRRAREKLGFSRPSKLERQARRRDIRGSGTDEIQIAAFDALVKDGTYDTEFDHPAFLREFFSDCLSSVLNGYDGEDLSVLECGCGVGAWLSAVDEICERNGWPKVQLSGFDLTPAMVDVARRRLSGREPPTALWVGNALQTKSYSDSGKAERYDVVYAYDLIQQLPRAHQLVGCEHMLSVLKPGGKLIVFDHDRNSSYGRKMGAKKFLTRYLGIPLVPRFYCNARYPRLTSIAQELGRRHRCHWEMRLSQGGAKKALIIDTSRPPGR